MRRRKLLRMLVLVLVAILSTIAISGCGTSPTSLEQDTGSYALTATANSGTATLETVNLTVTVL